MAKILKGAPVAEAMTAQIKERAEALRAKGVAPTLAILRVGAKEDDLAYERSATKRCEAAGVSVRIETLPEDVTQKNFEAALTALADDTAVHGILIFQPLPQHLDASRISVLLPASKDVDGCTLSSQAAVFANRDLGFAPCTAQAVLEILDYYGIPIEGKHAVILGRSMVIGRPVAMLLMHQNATPTICHTKTKDAAAIARGADILIAATGQPESVDLDYVNSNQTVIDVGISWNPEKEKLVGDVDFDAVEPNVAAITPVPGGVGSVTAAVLAEHVVRAAE